MKTVFTCPHTLKVSDTPTRGHSLWHGQSDSVRGRGKVCEANLKSKSKGGWGVTDFFKASGKIDMYYYY